MRSVDYVVSLFDVGSTTNFCRVEMAPLGVVTLSITRNDVSQRNRPGARSAPVDVQLAGIVDVLVPGQDDDVVDLSNRVHGLAVTARVETSAGLSIVAKKSARMASRSKCVQRVMRRELFVLGA